MNNIDALYAAICQSPCEDVPRLIYADALDERGQPGDSLRAEFIRKSIELSQLGDPHQKIENVIAVRHGLDLFTVDLEGADGDFLEKGDRVDVSCVIGGEESYEKRKYDGLLVVKTSEVEEADFVRLTLKRDEYSVPFPKKKHAELTKFVFNELKKHWKEWFPVKVAGSKVQTKTYNGEFTIVNMGAQTTGGAHYPILRFDRGFVSRITLPWSHWVANFPHGVTCTPITHVEFMEAPDFDHDKNGVTVAGQLIPWGYVTSPGFGDSYDEWVEEKLTTFLSLRWPTIPPENWTLSD